MIEIKTAGQKGGDMEIYRTTKKFEIGDEIPDIGRVIERRFIGRRKIRNVPEYTYFWEYITRKTTVNDILASWRKL